jgi:hypothetical protein
MIIQVNNRQLAMLVRAVKLGLEEARSEAEDIFYTGAPDKSGDWADLFRLLRSINKHQKKLRPKRHGGRISKRRVASIGRALARLAR